MKKLSKGSKSKRVSTHSRQVVTQRVKQHKRKVKKEAKKLSSAGFRKTAKSSNQNSDLPNLMPLKKRIVKSLISKKQSSLRDKQITTLSAKTVALTNQAVVQEDAATREANFLDSMAAKNAVKTGPKMKRNYMKELKEIIQNSDIILEVLDARDPEGCRCREMELEILAANGDKKIILVLNKIDLVPIEVVQLWKKKLSKEFACVLFKANTQGQAKDFGQTKLFNSSVKDKKDLVKELLTSSKSVGPDKLLELIKNYSKTEGVKTAVAVGVIGFPNVGKSSLINSMKKKRAVGVSSTAGYTTHLQEVEIDSKVKIIDSPGVILSKEDEVTLVLRNQINASEVKDPITPIERMLNLVNKDDMLMQYKIADYKDARSFLLNVAKARGKYIKGGIPNLEEAARVVIGDWSHGKIKYYSIPEGYKVPASGEMDEEIKDFHNELIYLDKEEGTEMCEE